MSLDPAGGAGALPGEGQRLIELIEPGRLVLHPPGVFFFLAWSMNVRTSSRRW